jgi:fructose-bisphosphate aldolase class II
LGGFFHVFSHLFAKNTGLCIFILYNSQSLCYNNFRNVPTCSNAGNKDWRIFKMPLVSAKEMLTKAKAGHYAVGQFNINNLEWTKAILLTAQELNSPVILGVSEGAGKYMCGYKTIVGMVNGMLEELNITVPVALHLDHGSYEGAKKCIEAGFSSIMFDGSHYPIEENIEKTKELVAICEEKGMSIEAEVGSIGGEEDGVVGMGECADPNECKMIADLGVTMLAAGIGNIHGKYPENWAGLSFETLAAVQEKTGMMPLVLHGGTGIPADMIKKAIDLGVSKINVNTECQLAFADATRKYIEAGKDLQGKGFDPRKLLAPGFEAIKATVKEKMELFGSVNKA